MSQVKVPVPADAAEKQPGDEIRRFPIEGIRAAIEQATATIPAGHTFAVIGHYDLTGRARLAALKRLDGGWSFAGVFEHTPERGFTGEAAVMWSR